MFRNKNRRGHERCKIDEVEKIDLIDHVERYNFASKFAANMAVLDIACGTGYGSIILKDAGAYSVTGVDISKDAVEYAKQNSTSEVNYFYGSIIDFNGGTKYDCIVSFETIEHVDDYMKALKHLWDLLKDDGILILSTPNRLVNSPECLTIDDKPLNPYHIREFSVNEMENILMETEFSILGKYGQKHRKIIKNRLIYVLYFLTTKLIPFYSNHFNCKVTPLKEGLEPRYMVFICKKYSNNRV